MLDCRDKIVQDAVAAGALISGTTPLGYERVGLFALDELLPFVNTGYRMFGGYWVVDTTSSRYELFQRQRVCVKCGVEGTYFALERNMKRTVIGSTTETGTTLLGLPFKREKKIYGWVHDPNALWHFNLYGVKDGKEVMLTKDHIHPKSKGGANEQENYQCMCIRCNGKKADTVSTVKA